MKLRIANQVTLAIGLLLFLFFMTSAVSYLLTTRIEDDVLRWTRVDEPRQNALIEMDARIVAATAAAAAYARQGDPKIGEQIREAERGFLGSAKTFLDLTKAGRERSLGQESLDRFETYRILVSNMIETGDGETARLAALRSGLNALEGRILQRVQAVDDSNASANVGRIKAILGMGVALQTILGASEGYRLSGDPRLRDRARKSEEVFEILAARYAEARGAAGDRSWLEGVRKDFIVIARARDDVLGLVDERRRLITAIEGQGDRLRALITQEILPLIRGDRQRAESGVTDSIQTVITYLLLMTAFGVILGSGAAVLLTRGIVKPIQVLQEGAEAIGKGELKHRIPVMARDEIGQLAESFNRMAENRQRTEDTLRDLAHHDTLTKLPNRTLFQARLAEALDNAERTNRIVAVHLLDLDHFKEVNDSLGHPVGDMLLQQVAGRLTACARRSDTVARLGGDEFAIIQTNLTYHNGIAVMARRVIDSVAKPFELGDELVFTGTSVGITVFPHDDKNPDQLLKNADLALYRAKQEGGGRYQLYDPEMNADVQARRALERDLRRALEKDELSLQFQPQIELAGGHVKGAEALVRWNHPERGAIPPGEFISVAEQSGLIIPLTEFVMREACRQATKWQRDGVPPVRVSVNLSPADFKRKDLIPTVTNILNETGLDPNCLELEITEGMVMTGVASVIATLEELHSLGIDLAIDDFGTGYSSLSYLKQFPVDRLKIDQSFVRELHVSQGDRSLTKAIIKLGHSLRLKVIAEGVETAEQLEFLRLRDCDEAQGYYIGRPMAAGDFARFAMEHSDEREPKASEIA